MKLEREDHDMEMSDIQRLIIGGYPKLPDTRYLLISDIRDISKARDFLRLQIEHVGRANDVSDKELYKMAIAFTHPGLEKFFDKRHCEMRKFDLAFREGMSGDNERRARLLGDTGDSCKELWKWGRENEIQVLLILFFKKDCKHPNWNDLFDEIREFAKLRIIEAIIRKDKTEPFGFRDGISQPVIEGTAVTRRALRERGPAIKPGEFIFGYENESNVLSECPGLETDPNWGRNGTYLVMRQLYQDVEAFEQFLTNNSDESGKELLAAKLVGRWRSGAPLILAPEKDNRELRAENDFAFYKSDRYGYICPLGAHIRRANPRDALLDEKLGESLEDALAKVRKHRMIRRGRVYDAGCANGFHDQGLVFVCLNASIEDQFEFIQRAWIIGKPFPPIEGEDDPLLGSDSKYTLQYPYVPKQLTNLSPFVQVRGGAYFFLPGIKALCNLVKVSDSH